MTCGQQTIADNMHAPVCGLGENTAFRLQLVFDKERHDLCQANGFFLSIGEASDLLAFNQWPALWCLHMPQRAWRMADKRDRLASRK